MTAWLRKLKKLLRKQRFESELNDEFAFHLEMRERRFVEEGMSAEEAHRAARRYFGNVTRAQEESRHSPQFRLTGSDLERRAVRSAVAIEG
jgi:hypothetical protein